MAEKNSVDRLNVLVTEVSIEYRCHQLICRPKYKRGTGIVRCDNLKMSSVEESLFSVTVYAKRMLLDASVVAGKIVLISLARLLDPKQAI